MHRSNTILSVAMMAVVAATMGTTMVLAADEPFSISLSGTGGRNAPLPASVDGKVIYEHICQSCHMPDGKGAKILPSSYPALAGNAKLGVRTYPVMMVVNGTGAMPAFGASLSDAQVALVVNYVRSSFGNTFADALTPADVKSARPAMQSVPTELRGR